MNLQNSHAPYEVPADFPRRLGPDPKTLDFSVMFASFPPEKADQVKGLYSNSLAYVDWQIGRLVEHLERTGRWQDTLMVITGDTGQAFYEHGFAAHGSHIFDEVMRVPLIIRAPGHGARRLDRTAEHVDVLPTILHLLGLPPHPTCQGLNLLAEEFPEPRSAYILVQNGVFEEYGIIRGDWKLISFVRWNHEMLFNLAQDPGEQNNVLHAHPDVAGRLRRRLHTWRLEQLDYYGRKERYEAEYPPVLLDGR
jgi:arylsulfatase A-like enzyme